MQLACGCSWILLRHVLYQARSFYTHVVEPVIGTKKGLYTQQINNSFTTTQISHGFELSQLHNGNPFIKRQRMGYQVDLHEIPSSKHTFED